jgi:hypothetical protein
MKRLVAAICLPGCAAAALSLFAQNPGGVAIEGTGGIVANRMSGPDIGAKIDAAFAGCGSVPSCTVLLLPGQTYDYEKTIEIPGGKSTTAIVRPTLDCQGSTLNFKGTGDAIVVHGANGAGPATTGGIYNCVIQSAKPHSATVTSLIHIRGRIGFTLSRLQLMNAANCVDWENTNADGGPGYNEEDLFEHIESSGCTNHLATHVGEGGTASFEYNRIDDWHVTLQNYIGEEHGWALLGGGASFDTQGGIFDFKTNTQGSASGPTVSLIYITNNNHLGRSIVNLHGENTAEIRNAYSVYIESGDFYNAGNNITADLGVYVSTSNPWNKYVLHPALNSIPATDTDLTQWGIHYELESSSAPQRICKWDIATSIRLWMASYGGKENNCEFQILGRITDNNNADVYHKGSGGNAPYNIFYINSLDRSVCIGSGYGPTGTGGAHCTHPLEVNGVVAAKSVSNSRGTPASSSEACEMGESWDDVNYHYHCVAKNTIKRVALASF